MINNLAYINIAFFLLKMTHKITFSLGRICCVTCSRNKETWSASYPSICWHDLNADTYLFCGKPVSIFPHFDAPPTIFHILVKYRCYDQFCVYRIHSPLCDTAAYDQGSISNVLAFITNIGLAPCFYSSNRSMWYYCCFICGNIRTDHKLLYGVSFLPSAF